MKTKYIDYGKVRPTVESNWSKNKSYECITFVKNNSNVYISKKDVPSNIELSNEEYWLLLFEGSEGGDVSTKLNCYNYNNSIVYIKDPNDGYLIHAFDIGDSNNGDALYYISGIPAYCIHDNLGANKISVCSYSSNEYLKLDFLKDNKNIKICIIPLSNKPIEIYTDLSDITDEHDLDINTFSTISFTAIPGGVSGDVYVSADVFTEIVDAYTKNGRIKIQLEDTNNIEDIIGISSDTAFTRSWIVRQN